MTPRFIPSPEPFAMHRPPPPGRPPLAAPLAALSLLVAALGGASALHGQDVPIAFQGARILPISGPEIENGTLVVHQGVIRAVGASGTVEIPGDARVVDATGKVIMPGLVDTHSHIGGGDGGDGTSALHPAVRILDALDARDDGIRKARTGGVTTVNVMPGSGHLMSGQTAYLKLRDGRTIYDLLLCSDVQREICGGMKMANGTNPRRDPPFPGTRARAAAMVRSLFVRAQEYQEKLAAAEADPSVSPPARDLEMEALVEVLDGRRIVHFHTHRHDDVLTVLRLAREFGFRVVLQHVSDAWLVADEIAAAPEVVGSSIIIIDAPGGKLEAVNVSFESGGALERAGQAVVGFHTDDGITDSRFFLRSAALAVRAGMSRDFALRAMTLAGAEMMDLDHRVGSLDPGKDADFIILSGDPLSVYTRVQETWIEGRQVFDLSNPDHRPFAIGGYGVMRDSGVHVHHGWEDHR
jgi:imidazolonepropionase-like amidohydrolase